MLWPGAPSGLPRPHSEEEVTWPWLLTPGSSPVTRHCHTQSNPLTPPQTHSQDKHCEHWHWLMIRLPCSTELMWEELRGPGERSCWGLTWSCAETNCFGSVQRKKIFNKVIQRRKEFNINVRFRKAKVNSRKRKAQYSCTWDRFIVKAAASVQRLLYICEWSAGPGTWVQSTESVDSYPVTIVDSDHEFWSRHLSVRRTLEVLGGSLETIGQSRAARVPLRDETTVKWDLLRNALTDRYLSMPLLGKFISRLALPGLLLPATMSTRA